MANTVVVNLQQVRADRAASAPVCIGPDGIRYPVGGVPLDVFLEIVDLQQAYADAEVASVPLEIFRQFKVLIERVLPGFPAGDLTIEELMLLVNALQSGIGPQSDTEASESDPGELTPP